MGVEMRVGLRAKCLLVLSVSVVSVQ